MEDTEKQQASSRKSTGKSKPGTPGRKTPQSGRASPGKKSTGKKTPTAEKPKTPDVPDTTDSAGERSYCGYGSVEGNLFAVQPTEVKTKLN